MSVFRDKSLIEGTASDSTLSVLPLHNKIILAFQQFLDSFCMISRLFLCLQLNTLLYRDWVQLTHAQHNPIHYTYKKLTITNTTTPFVRYICFFFFFFVLFMYTLQHHSQFQLRNIRITRKSY